MTDTRALPKLIAAHTAYSFANRDAFNAIERLLGCGTVDDMSIDGYDSSFELCCTRRPNITPEFCAAAASMGAAQFWIHYPNDDSTGYTEEHWAPGLLRAWRGSTPKASSRPGPYIDGDLDARAALRRLVHEGLVVAATPEARTRLHALAGITTHD